MHADRSVQERIGGFAGDVQTDQGNVSGKEQSMNRAIAKDGLYSNEKGNYKDKLIKNTFFF